MEKEEGNLEKSKDEKFYSDTYEAIWNQYLYIAEGRSRFEHRFEILLVLVGIYLAVYVDLGIYKIHYLNYIPLSVGFGIFLLALYRVIPRKIWVPWVSIEEFDKYEKSGHVHKQLIDECYNYIKDIRDVEKRETIYLKIITLSLLFSVIFPAIPTIFARNYSLFLSSNILIVIVFVALIILEIVFYKKFDSMLVSKSE